MIAHDLFPAPDWAATHDVSYVDLDALLAESDVVSLHLPLTPQTHYLLNATTLARMKRGAHLINTSRGKLVDTTALIEALKSGHIGGVALDVYEFVAGSEGLVVPKATQHGAKRAKCCMRRAGRGT